MHSTLAHAHHSTCSKEHGNAVRARAHESRPMHETYRQTHRAEPAAITHALARSRVERGQPLAHATMEYGMVVAVCDERAIRAASMPVAPLAHLHLQEVDVEVKNAAHH